MDWIISATCETWLDVSLWVLRLSVVFAVLTYFMPCNRGMHWWKNLRAASTDLLHWFVTPLVLRVCHTVVLTLAIAFLFGGEQPGFATLRELPFWQQCLAILLLQDVMLYWLHRAFHTRSAWKIHAVHHSPTVLDWPSAGRNHIVNHLLTVVLVDVATRLLGFAPAAIVLLAPLQVFYSSMVHANLNWSFGPLRYVFASPVFHRWHHTTEAEGLDKNFASTFAFLDLLFGTFYLPPGKVPEQFGVDDPSFPEGYFGQQLYPFLSPASSPAPEAAKVAPRRQAA